jgi:hypothetical protein
VSKKLLLALVGLATGALVLGCRAGDLGAWIPAVAVVGGLWLLGVGRGWSWASGAGFVAYALVAAAALVQGGEVGWILPGLGMALACWDLDGLSQRMQDVERVEGRSNVVRGHLARLFAVEVVGMLLAAAALGVSLRPSFGVVLLLGLAAAVGLSRAIGVLSHEGW